MFAFQEILAKPLIDDYVVRTTSTIHYYLVYTVYNYTCIYIYIYIYIYYVVYTVCMVLYIHYSTIYSAIWSILHILYRVYNSTLCIYNVNNYSYTNVMIWYYDI